MSEKKKKKSHNSLQINVYAAVYENWSNDLMNFHTLRTQLNSTTADDDCKENFFWLVSVLLLIRSPKQSSIVDDDIFFSFSNQVRSEYNT